MPLLGTIVNVLAIAVGTLVGLLLKKGLSERYKNIVVQGIGLAVIFAGSAGAVHGLLDPESEPILFIISLVMGGLLGEWINVEKRLRDLGDLIHKQFQASGHNIAEGFVSASLIFCVGTMAIMGSLNSGLRGDHNMLYAKAVLDGVTSIVLASTLGAGVLFSGVAVFLYQGLIVLFAHRIGPYLSDAIIREISIVGGILIAAIGISILQIKDIKTGNLLPAIVIPPLYYLVVLPLKALF